MPLSTMVSASPINGAIQRKIRRKGVAKVGIGISLVISNEKMDDIIRVIKSPENIIYLLLLSIDGASETVKHEIKKQGGEFPGMLFGNLDASMLGNMLTGKSVLRCCKSRNRI